MVTPTWATREIPILEAIEARATSLGGPRWEDVVTATGLPANEVRLSLRRLYENGYIDGNDVTGMGVAGFELLDIRLLEPGLRAIGAWPSDPYAELVAVLEDDIAGETDPEQRSRLERLLKATIDVGQVVATGILIEVARRTIDL